MALKTADRLSLTCQRLAICHILPALAIAIVPYLPADIPKTILPYTLRGMGENASVRATGALPAATLAVSSRTALSPESDSAVSFIPREGGDRSVQLFRIRRCAASRTRPHTPRRWHRSLHGH